MVRHFPPGESKVSTSGHGREEMKWCSAKRPTKGLESRWMKKRPPEKIWKENNNIRTNCTGEHSRPGLFSLDWKWALNRNERPNRGQDFRRRIRGQFCVCWKVITMTNPSVKNGHQERELDGSFRSLDPPTNQPTARLSVCRSVYVYVLLVCWDLSIGMRPTLFVPLFSYSD
jgi:hypothetical protein